MGVEHFIVDYAGRHVLDLHKWYDLDPADYDNVTREDLRTAGERNPAKAWIAVAALAWVDEFVGARPVALRTDMTDCEDDWSDYMPGEGRRLRDGWTLHETHTGGDGVLYRPPAVVEALAARALAESG